MTHTEFFAQVKKGEIARAYLFEGEEEYVKERALETLRQKLLPEGLEALNETTLQNPAAAQLIECAEMVPVMAEKRLVVANECAYVANSKAAGDADGAERLTKYLDTLPETTCIVFYVKGLADGRKKLSQALKKKAAAVRFDPLTDAELNKWIAGQFRPLGKIIAPQTAMQLAFTSGRELMLLSQEIKKLAAFVGERTEITPSDVERAATRTAECTVFQMADALVAGKAAEAFRLLSVLLENGEARIGVLAMIARQYRNMLYYKLSREAGMPDPEIARQIGVPPFAVRRLADQVRRETAQSLKEKLDLCVDTDYAIKSGRMRDDAALERAMMRLCQRAQ